MMKGFTNLLKNAVKVYLVKMNILQNDRQIISVCVKSLFGLLSKNKIHTQKKKVFNIIEQYFYCFYNR